MPRRYVVELCTKSTKVMYTGWMKRDGYKTDSPRETMARILNGSVKPVIYCPGNTWMASHRALTTKCHVFLVVHSYIMRCTKGMQQKGCILAECGQVVPTYKAGLAEVIIVKPVYNDRWWRMTKSAFVYCLELLNDDTMTNGMGSSG